MTPIPKNLESNAAASILCAVYIICFLYALPSIDTPIQGLTVYRAIKYSETEAGDWIVLPGAGGGLGHLGNVPTHVSAAFIQVHFSHSICKGSRPSCDCHRCSISLNSSHDQLG